jgi:methionyl-tRNA formyltransferase
MIYLFCNEKYGYLFMQTALRYAKYYPISLTIVLSGKNKASPLRWNQIKSKAALFLGDFYRKTKIPYQLLTVKNINSSDFYQTVLPSSHGIIAGFNQIFKLEAIKHFQTLVNFHPSILPFYRGPVPSHWCIQYQEELTGYTLHKVTDKVDQGEILFQGKVAIENIKDPEILDQKIAAFATPCLWEYLDHIVGDLTWHSQVIDSKHVYKNPINYLSFPREQNV